MSSRPWLKLINDSCIEQTSPINNFNSAGHLSHHRTQMHAIEIASGATPPGYHASFPMIHPILPPLPHLRPLTSSLPAYVAQKPIGINYGNSQWLHNGNPYSVPGGILFGPAPDGSYFSASRAPLPKSDMPHRTSHMMTPNDGFANYSNPSQIDVASTQDDRSDHKTSFTESKHLPEPASTDEVPDLDIEKERLHLQIHLLKIMLAERDLQIAESKLMLENATKAVAVNDDLGQGDNYSFINSGAGSAFPRSDDGLKVLQDDVQDACLTESYTQSHCSTDETDTASLCEDVTEESSSTLHSLTPPSSTQSSIILSVNMSRKSNEQYVEAPVDTAEVIQRIDDCKTRQMSSRMIDFKSAKCKFETNNDNMVTPPTSPLRLPHDSIKAGLIRAKVELMTSFNSSQSSLTCDDLSRELILRDSELKVLRQSNTIKEAKIGQLRQVNEHETKEFQRRIIQLEQQLAVAHARQNETSQMRLSTTSFDPGFTSTPTKHGVKEAIDCFEQSSF